MASKIDYQKIFSRFYAKVTAYDLVEKSQEITTSLQDEWLHSVIAKPMVKRLFSSISLDDEIQIMEYQLKSRTNNDDDFVIEVAALGMIIEWLSPKVNHVHNYLQVFSNTDQKFYSQSMHLTATQNAFADAEARQGQMIADYNVTWNSYLGNEDE